MLDRIKENKYVVIVSILSIVAMISIIGYTFSFFQVTVTNNTVIAGQTESLKLDLSVSKVLPNNSEDLIPQLDTAITKAVIGAAGKSGCIDDNNNTVCNVFKVTLKNSSSSSVHVNGTIELTAENIPNLKWAVISGTSNPTLVSSINPKATTVLTENELYTGGQTKEYYIVIWMSETGSIQTDRGSYSGIVTFDSGDGTSNIGGSGGSSGGGGSGSDIPVGGGTAEGTLTSLGLSVSEGNPNFSNTSCSSGCGEATVGIYETEDDLGTSYYFRGDVVNNYVKFGKNASNQDMWWRIIRINGDGTVRMIYDGTQAHANGESSTDRQVTKKAFNSTHNDNTYVGYMIGTPGITATGTVGYNATHSNSTDSTMKIYLEGDGTTSNEGWYKDNIVDTGYGSYVADAIYCNDRSLSTAGSYTGIGNSESYYGAHQRNNTNKSPSLICNSNNNNADKFTTNTSLGNGKNKQPVGLITADEVALAGGKNGIGNSKFYLYTGNTFWTMSPCSFSGSYARVFYVDSSGNLGNNNVNGVSSTYGVRPVVSLKSNVLQYGSGTTSDPFRTTQ